MDRRLATHLDGLRRRWRPETAGHKVRADERQLTPRFGDVTSGPGSAGPSNHRATVRAMLSAGHQVSMNRRPEA
jgi:hypothetical protein